MVSSKLIEQEYFDITVRHTLKNKNKSVFQPVSMDDGKNYQVFSKIMYVVTQRQHAHTLTHTRTHTNLVSHSHTPPQRT